jgi:DNA-binding XRE family transcriptional regulator
MKLDEWIRESGSTRYEIAQQLGISTGHMTDLCNGRFWPSLKMALKIRRLTKGQVMPNDFLPDED